MKVLVIAADKGNHFAPFIEEQMTALQACGVEIIRYGVIGKGITGYLRELPVLHRMIRAERPDIIHAHYGLCGLLANLQCIVPVVTTYHGSDINDPAILHFSKVAMRLSAYNIFVSKRNVALAMGIACSLVDGAERLLKPLAFRLSPFAFRFTNHSTLLPCGVNLTDDQLQSRSEARAFLDIDEDAEIVLFAGAFNNAVKDPTLAQEVVKEVNRIVSQSLEDVDSSERLLMLSSNKTVPHADKQVELKELKGFDRSQVNRLMCAANALLMTSKTEGSPQVVKEAMACGCPIVSVDVGDVAERVSGVDGCYVVPTREPKDITAALLKAIQFEGKTKGREKIVEMGLSNEQVAERLLCIYKQLLV